MASRSRDYLASDDAFPFPLCISSTTDAAHGSLPVFGVTVARGNVVPADHGVWIEAEPSAKFRQRLPHRLRAPAATAAQRNLTAPFPRYYPELANAPLRLAPYSGALSATAFLAARCFASPRHRSRSSAAMTHVWLPLTGSLSSDDTQTVFVSRSKTTARSFSASATTNMARPRRRVSHSSATYRVGNGAIGNIGRDSLGHVVLPPDFRFSRQKHQRCAQSLAAAGGVDPENMNHIVQYAPFSYESQLRCVTEADYGQAARNRIHS